MTKERFVVWVSFWFGFVGFWFFSLDTPGSELLEFVVMRSWRQTTVRFKNGSDKLMEIRTIN